MKGTVVNAVRSVLRNAGSAPVIALFEITSTLWNQIVFIFAGMLIDFI
jgi:hypothetical protein